MKTIIIKNKSIKALGNINKRTFISKNTKTIPTGLKIVITDRYNNQKDFKKFIRINNNNIYLLCNNHLSLRLYCNIYVYDICLKNILNIFSE